MSDFLENDTIITAGSPARKALAHIWRGDEVTIISSPPGAGKTEIITSLVPYLWRDLGASVIVACPTIAGAYDVAYRMSNKAKDAEIVLVGSSFNSRKSRGVPVHKKAPEIYGRRPPIQVRTIASASMSRPTTDILVIDEAYQATALQVREAAGNADQVLLVGDPGQIGPVITIDTEAWDGNMSPAKRAPDMFRHWKDASIVHLDRTFRLGPKTTTAISGLYDFSFKSARPSAKVSRIPEVSILDVGTPSTPADLATLRKVVKRAESFIDKTYTYNGTKRQLETIDIALLASRNEQVAMLESLVASNPQTRGMIVGTADSLQGGQWPVALAVDPLLGATKASGHALTQGRICVMCSRHIAHLTFVTCENVHDLIDEADISDEDKAVHHDLRRRLSDAAS